MVILDKNKENLNYIKKYIFIAILNTKYERCKKNSTYQAPDIKEITRRRVTGQIKQKIVFDNIFRYRNSWVFNTYEITKRFLGNMKNWHLATFFKRLESTNFEVACAPAHKKDIEETKIEQILNRPLGKTEVKTS